MIKFLQEYFANPSFFDVVVFIGFIFFLRWMFMWFNGTTAMKKELEEIRILLVQINKK